MTSKKLFVLTLFIVSLFAISTVSASSNQTDDVVSAELVTNDVASLNDVKNEYVTFDDNASNSQEVLAVSGNNEEISLNINEEILSNSSRFPRYDDYSVNIVDTTIRQGSGNISISITPCSQSNYDAYAFYLLIYDYNENQTLAENQTWVLKETFWSSTSNRNTTSLSFSKGLSDLSEGTYTMEIVNHADGYVMDTATLKVVSDSDIYPFYDDYSVSLPERNTSVVYGGSIRMYISPSNSTYYNYYYYLRIYDSNGDEKISSTYYSSSASSSYFIVQYYEISSNSSLSPGKYTIKVVNYADDVVMANATLKVFSDRYPDYDDYSVSLPEDLIIGSAGDYIYMNISPSYSTYYSFSYYLSVFNEDGDEVISKSYVGIGGSGSFSQYYYVSPNSLSHGFYTAKIYNQKDKKVMDTKDFYVVSDVGPSYNIYPYYKDYSVSVQDTVIDYDNGGKITMNISLSPSPSYNSYYKYYLRLRIYDSNGTRITSWSCWSDSASSSSISRYYHISSNWLSPGNYTMYFVNYEDDKVMDTARLTIADLPKYQDYSVSVDDASITYGSTGSIEMYVNPSTSSDYGYYYYLNVFDSNGDKKINKLYYNASTTPGYIYYSIAANQLSPGVYTVEIKNYADDVVMANATLKITNIYPEYDDYSVSVQDTSITYGNGGSIMMYVDPSTFSRYGYNFYVNVFDSNGNQRINKLYYSTSATPGYKYYSVGATQLGVGVYTVEIKNYADDVVMANATLKIINIYPRYTDYSVSVQDTSITYGNGGSIMMYVDPSTFSRYGYNFYVNVFDSNGNQRINKLYYSTSATPGYKYYSVGATQLGVGVYTVKIVNYADDKVMDTAKLTIKKIYPGYDDYSVSLYDASIAYGNSGNIKMYVDPFDYGKYGYNFYLNVFDSNGNQRINKLYYSSSNSSGYKYYSIAANQLSPGIYTVEAVNYADSVVMDNATLKITNVYPRYTDYSVSVQNTSITYGNSGNIKMYVDPSDYSRYGYNFYVNVFDSNGNQRINKLYYSTSTTPGYKYYSIAANQLGPGVYTVKIVNYGDSKVMGTAKITVKNNYPYYRDYNVTVQDTSIVYADGGSISMYVNPSTSSNYVYDYYLNVFDSNGNQRINKLYYSTSSSSSSPIYNSYSISANQLGVGVYTVKIVNYADNKVMDTAKLTVKN